MHTNLKQTSAQLAELVDALDSNSSIERCAGSIPALGTKPEKGDNSLSLRFFFGSLFIIYLIDIVEEQYPYRLVMIFKKLQFFF